ncbi:hypothetical protein K523DRAFT_312792 [Schizophyllum commune Tattone D]|nr:hypothetical protein K523DRAFT_312792 [Schizophyllum commune Tattone D]
MANNLPPELLSQILLASLPENWGTLRPFATRLAISHVCCYWRELCLNSQEIWQRVTYEYSTEGCTRRLDEIEPLREYLRRSAGSPLSVALLTGGDDVDMDMDVYGRLFQVQDIWHLVFAESQRWVSARLVRDGRVRIPVPYSKALDVPNLVQFQYICPTSSAYSYALDPSVTFRWLADASSLRRLYLTEPFVPSQMQAPWGQLTHLDLYLVDQASLHECVAILPRCTAVEYLTLSVFTAKWNERFPIVEAPSLHALTLYDDAVYLLCYIRVPNLTRLALRTERLLTVRQYDAFAMLAQREPPVALRSLTIQQPLRYPQRLEQMLDSIPGLNHLKIKDKCFPQISPMSQLSSAFRAIGKARSLQSLSLQLCLSGWLFPDVVQLLDKQISQLPKLKSLHLWGVPEAERLAKAEEYIGWIDGLRGRGIYVRRHEDCMQEGSRFYSWAE